MSEIEEALLAAVPPGADEDVLVLADSKLALGVREQLGEGWVYVVQREVDALEELLGAAHSDGAAGLAYLVGELPVLPLPDGAVGAVVGRVPSGDGEPFEAGELARILSAGGRLALAAPSRSVAGGIAEALETAGFADVSVADAGDDVVVSGIRG